MFRCGKMGHLKAHCKTKTIKRWNKEKRVNKISKVNGNVTKRKFVNVKIEKDTGSDITIVGEETWKYMSKPKLSKYTKLAHVVMGLRFIL